MGRRKTCCQNKDGRTITVLAESNEQQQQQIITLPKDSSCSTMKNILDLPQELLEECLSFLGPGNYLFVADVCRSFRDAYAAAALSYAYARPTQTDLGEIVASVPRVQMALREWERAALTNRNNIKLKWRGRKVMIWKAIVECAAWKGNLSVLAWAKENENCNWNTPTTSGACGEAARGGNLQVLQWLRFVGRCRWGSWDDETCKNAAAGGHLRVLQWAHRNGCPWFEQTCSWAARHGHLEILQWARRNGCPWTSWTCAYAAEAGQFELLKWAHENGCPWDVHTCARAAKGGHLHILKWARQHDCPWDKRTSYSATRNGHWDVLQWAHENGCP